MAGNRKEEGRVLIHIIRKSPTHRLTAILNRQKPKSVPGFEPDLPRQNAIALPLVPPPILKNFRGAKSATIFSLHGLSFTMEKSNPGSWLTGLVGCGNTTSVLRRWPQMITMHFFKFAQMGEWCSNFFNWFSFILSLNCSALAHSASVPPNYTKWPLSITVTF